MTKDNHKNTSMPLKNAVRRQATAPHLAPEKMQQLMAMQEAVLNNSAGKDSLKTQATQSESLQQRRWFMSMAAGFVLVISALLFNQWQQHADPTQGIVQDQALNIAQEVVKNHLKLKPLDVKANSIREIQRFFTQLDFSPVNSNLLPTRFALSEQSMLGGRYCSIKGVTAAQLRYQSGGLQDQQKLSTLYEVAYDPEHFGSIPDVDKNQLPKELLVKGLKVTLWVEKGLLMVLVSGA